MAVLELSQGTLDLSVHRSHPALHGRRLLGVGTRAEVRRPVRKQEERVTTQGGEDGGGSSGRFWVSLEGRTDGVS